MQIKLYHKYSDARSSSDIYFVRFLAILCLSLLSVIGPYFPYLGLNSLRLLIIGITLPLFYYLLMLGRNIADTNNVIRYHVILFVTWLIWGVISMLIFKPDVMAAAKQLSDIFFMLLFGAVMFCLVGDDWRFATRAIPIAWIITLAFTSVVAGWEITTGQHLRSSFENEIEDYAASKYVAVSTFGNPNNYSAYLLLCLPYAFLLPPLLGKGIKTMAHIALPITILALMLMSGSRIALVGFIVYLLLILIYIKRLFQAVVTTLIVAIAVTFGVYLSFISTEPFENLWVYSKLLSWITGEIDGSSGERLHIYLNGIYITASTFLVGGGPGSFNSFVQSSDMPYKILIPNPHSFLIEILSQYGIIVFTLFLVMCLRFAKHFLSIARNEFFDKETQFAAMALLAAIPAYIIAGFSNSSYISQPSNWFFIASIAAIARCTVLPSSKCTSIHHLTNR